MTFVPVAEPAQPVSSSESRERTRAAPNARMPPPVTLSSPLPADQLLFEAMAASAGLSQLGEMQLTLLSTRADLKPEARRGKPVTVKVQLREDAKRFFHGYVTRFGIGAHRGQYFTYQA